MQFFVVVMQADLKTNKIPFWATDTVSSNGSDAWHKFAGIEGFRKYIRLGSYMAEKDGYVLAQYDMEKNTYLPVK